MLNQAQHDKKERADPCVCPYDVNLQFTIYNLRSHYHPHLNPFPAYAKALADRTAYAEASAGRPIKGEKNGGNSHKFMNL